MEINQIDLMFRAFSDRTRLRILNILTRGEICVGDLVTTLNVPQPTASRHLAYLRRAGLVATRKEGLWAYYHLTPAESQFHQNLLNCLTGCFDQVPELARDLKTLDNIGKSQSCCPTEPTNPVKTTSKPKRRKLPQ